MFAVRYSYRGFDIHVEKQHHALQFSLIGTSEHQPDNLRYQADDKFSLSGFIQRIDNYLSKLKSWREAAHHKLVQERSEYQTAQQTLGKPFSEQQRLELLRQDVREVVGELKKMQVDENYVSTWQPQSRQVQAKDNDTQQLIPTPGNRQTEDQPDKTKTAQPHQRSPTADNPQAVLKLAEQMAKEKFSNAADRQRFLEKVNQRLFEKQQTKQLSPDIRRYQSSAEEDQDMDLTR